jgi:hypothetical protein
MTVLIYVNTSKEVGDPDHLRGASELGPLFPQQQTCDDCFGMSERCQIRKWAPMPN